MRIPQKVTRISIEFENGVVNWIALADAQEWYDAIDASKLPKKGWGGGRQSPPEPGLLDNVFAVIWEHMGVDRSQILGLGGSSGGAKRACAFAAYLAWYREPHVTLFNLARAFEIPLFGGLGVEILRARLEEVAELKKDEADLKLFYKMLYALLDLDTAEAKIA